MADYLVMQKSDLEQEQKGLLEQLEHFHDLGLKLDMSRGKPAPDQLDLSMDMLEITDYVDDTGVDARNYGNLDGIPEAKRYFAELLEVTPEETFVGGNASLDLMYSMIDMGCKDGFDAGDAPWSSEAKPKFLCPVPGYDRHFRITEVMGFELVTVPMTPTGPAMDIVEKLVQDPSVKGIWCIPLYSNPDGYVYSDETVRRLAKMETASPSFRIFWDNAYGFHHLTEQPETILNIMDECRKAGQEDRPLIFCSTSKITFAGGGVGAMAASKKNMDLAKAYFMPKTIGFDKVNQLRHVRYLKKDGGLGAHMKKHAAILNPKFHMVLETLNNNLLKCGKIARWTEPKGGYFISLYVMDGCAKRIVEICKSAGVVLTGAGAAFPYGIDPDDCHIRIAPTFPNLEELETATQLLSIATRLASIEKLLAK